MTTIRNTRLTSLRKKRKLTQEQLALLVKRSQASITAYEIGTRTPDSRTMKKMADLFGVTVDFLFYKGKKENSITEHKGAEDND
ncbi:helix-turn-helix domain-containing protein [Viridibacillus arvi]|uniref:helix-turn-helix domain-containing protein n=1 Tax=Viridibacillus arvi TaxID=263475 RepID=UPI0034CE5E82